MRYIISENQEEFLHLLRRLHSVEYRPHMDEIIYEGFDMFNPCDYDNFETFEHKLLLNSAETFVWTYITDTSELQSKMIDIVYEIMKGEYGRFILERYLEIREDEC